MERCQNGCGRVVSANKLYCMECIEIMANDVVQSKDEPMDPRTTHIIERYSSSRPDTRATYKAEDLYRVDGLLIASRQDDVVRYGDDISTARNHLFMNEETASKFLHRLADVDMICQRDGVHLRERIYQYTNPELCPHAALIHMLEGGVKEVETAGGGKVRLALPGNMHSVKLH